MFFGTTDTAVCGLCSSPSSPDRLLGVSNNDSSSSSPSLTPSSLSSSPETGSFLSCVGGGGGMRMCSAAERLGCAGSSPVLVVDGAAGAAISMARMRSRMAATVAALSRSFRSCAKVSVCAGVSGSPRMGGGGSSESPLSCPQRQRQRQPVTQLHQETDTIQQSRQPRQNNRLTTKLFSLKNAEESDCDSGFFSAAVGCFVANVVSCRNYSHQKYRLTSTNQQ
jgi:hypothetical protein